MKVLSIGTDRKLFEEGSAVLVRQKEYADKMEESHIIIFSLKKLGFKPYSIGKLHIYPTNSYWRLGYVRDAVKIGKEIISKNSFKKGNSVITTQDPFETGRVGFKLKKISDLPFQVQIHTDFLDPYFKNSFLNWIRTRMAKKIILNADGIRVVSQVIADSIKKAFPNLKTKIEILPIFVDIEKIFNESESEKIPSSILMMSRFSKEKRIDIGLKVFAKVLAGNPSAMMTIIGSGPEKYRLFSLREKLKLTDKVKILEWKEDALSSYRNSEIFLLTSEFEGYGMTLVEAAAAGCPIVTTNVGIAKTDLFKNGENSFVCPVGDEECLADSIIRLLENESLRKLFKERMQASIKSTAISREKYIEKYVDLLRDLVQTHD